VRGSAGHEACTGRAGLWCGGAGLVRNADGGQGVGLVWARGTGAGHGTRLGGARDWCGHAGMIQSVVWVMDR
jgi:hypothetical protein